ncbi:transcriptional regulator [Dulcicalothrix desertica PCC 7102]|uniref:Transcriptional regulator n=1 Tax=Dulcicalothrix desertica PCC 7102 TaxID=232991 RepID=A0A3S1AHH2_9CYAN|nr:response regulator [Dulcicalothrix desertica]RUT00869.1 transcriptional regulator [Dulcicalothrix desertica PCC 7102]TWH42294.1 DNA-binding response OmpR family regulator [Dulcicalothrix desertica PCC 7102]
MKILIVEDDNSLASAIAGVLTKLRYVVDIANDGQYGWQLATTYNYDLILLDVLLPKFDGINICRQLRREGYQMPILLLTALDANNDKVIGLDAGADDYVVKPFDFQELTARIRALGRRGTSSLPPILEWGSLQLDPSSCEVTYANQVLYLTAKEFSILEFFLRNKQRIFNRSAIIDNLWGTEKDPPEEDTIKSHIKSLRQKLKSSGADYNLIETVYGMGYRLKPLSDKETSHAESESAHNKKALLAEIAKQQKAFKAKVGERVNLLKQHINLIYEGKQNPQLWEDAKQEAHKLVGSLGSFGFALASQIAEKIDNIFQDVAPINQAQSLHLCKLVVDLQRSLEQTDIDTNNTFTSNVLLVVSDDEQIAQQLVDATLRIIVNTATISSVVKSGVTSIDASVVLIDLDSDYDIKDSLKLIEEFSNRTPPIPTLVLTQRSSFNHRVEVARAGGRGFLNKLMSSEKILHYITQILQSVDMSEAKVMIVNNDLNVLNIIQKLLKPWGSKIKTLQDTCQFWDTLIEFLPDVLILGVKMPDIDGIELCQIVRNDPDFYSLPIMFIVDESQADISTLLYKKGADDCIIAPIKEAELITRILNRFRVNRLP